MLRKPTLSGIDTPSTALSASPSTVTVTNAPSSQQSCHQTSPSHVGAIVGGSIGGFVVIAITVAALLWYINRRRRNTKQQESSPGGNSSISLYENGMDARAQSRPEMRELLGNSIHELQGKPQTGELLGNQFYELDERGRRRVEELP